MGDLGVRRVTDDVMTKIDTGAVFLTNKRLLFMGALKNTTIRLSAIVDFTAYTNGVQIEKDRGRSPFLEFTRDVDLFAMLLGRALRDLA